MEELRYALRDLLKGFANLPLKRVDFEAADYYGYELELIENKWKALTDTDIYQSYPELKDFSDTLWNWKPEEEKDEDIRRQLINSAESLAEAISED